MGDAGLGGGGGRVGYVRERWRREWTGGYGRGGVGGKLSLKSAKSGTREIMRRKLEGYRTPEC